MSVATMKAAGTAQPAPETITGTLKSSAVSGAAAVAMQKNNALRPRASRLRTVLVRPSGLTTSTAGSWVGVVVALIEPPRTLGRTVRNNYYIVDRLCAE
jgi:hypothetical protein